MEVGYGLESVLTDGQSGEIIREQLAPAFRNGRYAEGFTDAIRSISLILVPSADSAPEPSARAKSAFKNGAVIFWFFVILLFWIRPSHRMSRSLGPGRRWGGGGFGGGYGGGFGGFGGGSSGGGGASGGW